MEQARNSSSHPYLAGNYAPIQRQLSQEPCQVEGILPNELTGGQYVRNGSNQLPYRDPGRVSHWFDGHGMLSAVYFHQAKGGDVQALFSNKYVLTDIYRTERDSLAQRPLLPSLGAMLRPGLSSLKVLNDVAWLIWSVLCSAISPWARAVKKISVANTNIVYHDGRVLALCESGPPMRVSLPDLQTVGWFDGYRAEGEPISRDPDVLASRPAGNSLLKFLHEWTTAHPHIDPLTKEMMLFHSTFISPYTRYSIFTTSPNAANDQLVGQPVPGMKSPKMMHDFGVSRQHTVIIDMPLSLNPLNLVYGNPIISFEQTERTRFGVFPRRSPGAVQWFTSEACCIFHTVNTWDGTREDGELHTTVNMIACRMRVPSIVYATGDMLMPTDQALLGSSDECRLYYYRFATDGPSPGILQQWALSAIPFEFPHVPKHLAMSAARFVYGCSVRTGTYAEQLANSMKISSLVKIDVHKLIHKGLKCPPTPVCGCVDERSVQEILAANDPDDPIQIFAMPGKVFAQECTFVPRTQSSSEDDGWLLTFVFDDSQLDSEGQAPDDAKSELWVIDARTMRDVVACVKLPQRVPFGLHGNWFSKDEIAQQRPVEVFRS
ncbi:hypothetical protein HIM_04251 [Hirsutella minnesotensis 3608]|uniref:Carotenoid oxygenase n=1 Tax=Hirsutella minnesotensis 3608 TaxID=1043627 RepID=A0A0F8A1U6_9HYPO|nr:hypothetical protein HIM_04251 [Hirsutella minnesotensis 3608]